MSDEPTERDVEALAGDLTYAVMRHYGYTPPDLAAAERVHPGRGCDDQCVNEDGESVHPVYDELQSTASLMVDVVEPIVAERIAQARREGAAEALREAADALDALLTHAAARLGREYRPETPTWLRDRAAALRGDDA